MSAPRLLLMSPFSALEWSIRPQLEEWADVAAFDAPGIGGEADPDAFESRAIAERAVEEVERRGWDGCVVAGDEYSIAAALRFGLRRPDLVQGLALGHACLSFNPAADPPPINREMLSALRQMSQFDDRTFVRHWTQVTQGHIGEEQADRMLERIPSGVGQAYLKAYTTDDGDWIEGAMREIGKPMLLAEHEGCLVFTKEGYEAAVEAFPEATTITCADKPNTSAEFGEALREFCRAVVPA
jgi:pimeloyl-ACP methyl ester carboxylesterase